jgi:hypothetical protein
VRIVGANGNAHGARCGAPQPRHLLDEPGVRAQHVVEIDGGRVAARNCLTRTRRHVDEDLQCGFETVEQPAEPPEPAQPIEL